MLLEWLQFEGEVRALHIGLGALIGLIFGVAAQMSRFCIRRAIASTSADRGQAGAIWGTALATALLAFLVAQVFGFVDLSEHRFWSSELPILAIGIGGLMFGAGMILTRGCISRLTVLSASGNLRAALVLVVFAIIAHATLKGVLAPARVAIGSVTVDAPFGTAFALPELSWALSLAAVVAAGYAVLRFRPRPSHVIAAMVIGLLPVIGWAGTSTFLMDDFDPMPVQSIAFTLPFTDSLFWTIASSALPATFGVGLIGGVLAGAFLSAAVRGDLRLQSFEDGRQTARYMSGAALMGVGGVLAGGCTIGAGLSGVATQSVAAMLALLAVVAGGLLADRMLQPRGIAMPAE